MNLLSIICISDHLSAHQSACLCASQLKQETHLFPQTLLFTELNQHDNFFNQPGEVTLKEDLERSESLEKLVENTSDPAQLKTEGRASKREEREEWAVSIDVNTPVDDFHTRVPDMAYKVCRGFILLSSFKYLNIQYNLTLSKLENSNTDGNLNNLQGLGLIPTEILLL